MVTVSEKQKEVAGELVSKFFENTSNSNLIIEKSVEDEIVIGNKVGDRFAMIVIDEYGNVMVSIKDPSSTIKERYFVDYKDIDYNKLTKELNQP